MGGLYFFDGVCSNCGDEKTLSVTMKQNNNNGAWIRCGNCDSITKLTRSRVDDARQEAY